MDLGGLPPRVINPRLKEGTKGGRETDNSGSNIDVWTEDTKYLSGNFYLKTETSTVPRGHYMTLPDRTGSPHPKSAPLGSVTKRDTLEPLKAVLKT